jgi:hypothetical protein
VSADSAAPEDCHLAELIALLYRSTNRVEALFSNTDADELGKHRNPLLTRSREIVILNSKHRLELSMAWSHGGQVQVKSCAAPSVRAAGEYKEDVIVCRGGDC